MSNKEKVIESATANFDKIETAVEKIKIDNDTIRVEMKEYHSVAYLDKLKQTTYKDQKVVFILPNGKEYK